jgi:hypothetical protein
MLFFILILRLQYVFKHHVVGHHVKTLQKCFSPAMEGQGFFVSILSRKWTGEAIILRKQVS